MLYNKFKIIKLLSANFKKQMNILKMKYKHKNLLKIPKMKNLKTLEPLFLYKLPLLMKALLFNKDKKKDYCI
jgi:hypothetical protein